MPSVTIYLRTSLFSLGGPNAHLPAGVMVVTGEEQSSAGGGMNIKVATVSDERGRDLGECKLLLRLPWAKIDHVVQHDG